MFKAGSTVPEYDVPEALRTKTVYRWESNEEKRYFAVHQPHKI
jgi:hypothetical protein